MMQCMPCIHKMRALQARKSVQFMGVDKELETKSLTQQHIHYMQTSMEKLQVQPGFYEVMACNVVSLCPAPLLSPLGAGLHLPSFANCGRRRMTSLNFLFLKKNSFFLLVHSSRRYMGVKNVWFKDNPRVSQWHPI